ncbi:2-oxoglutarate dehydrogenase, E2 component, dihydrolipoamide succinyltransferase [Rothia kristinae]|uniref:Dihydrolipoamide acetyltransferase component of pyruvate dehydrogenase complex n=1 Tax=Rothia kristinae TaxID=37923 RepID=A0A7T3F9A9_9MICC|nr:2-oxoglutarate dehydrogenase, E2 component, dihydrolipoamide succinyltransferase [Rothia kristinae]TDP57269.1 2-oxoglutarate dehydrogenase E2 component [Kocuria sp. AG109]SIM25253.1 2-oxoglutarate dehydrogenase, E2 component, dihydrolipoamide succinyltransferase [Mycobacteroides abscessus subsp. abscessus]KTR39190.1 dihydrolipoamide acetyltransferase [Rothia kristinae]KTR51787.1 dihydrolipoamide acetyltransferase [Rothia kristinae]KTR70849.1 dihydrolipoamide acetyltransferase [Rothia kristi
MSETVELPALGESVTEGTVTRWLKAVGDSVEVDEPLVEVSTDKVDTEIPSPVAGVIEEILVEEDEEVEVGAPLVKIGDGSGASSSDDDAAEDSAAAEESDDSAQQENESEPETPAEEKEQKDEESSSASSGSGEAQEVTLPALGESVTEGTVTRWLKEIGETVEVDEPLVEVSTDKVDTEIPSPVAGTLLEIKVQEDEEAEVGQVLALVGEQGASAGSAEPEPTPEQQAPAEQKEEKKEAEQPKQESSAARAEQRSAKQQSKAPEPAAATPAAGQSSGTPYVTPLVRKLAKQEGIDLSTIEGTGVGGRIRKQDVQAAVEAKKSQGPASAEQSAPASAPAQAAPRAEKPPQAPKPSAKRGTTEKAPRIRQVIAKRMKESLEVSAQLTQVTEVDMTRVAMLRNRAKADFQAREGAKLTFLPFFAKAVAEALQQHPVLNGSFDEEKKEITYNASEDLAFAVDTPRGLLVPVVPNAGDLNLAGLAKKIADVGARTKDGSIGPDELSGGTFTITNIGSFGALFDTPIINQPQVGILGTGTIVKRPMVVTDADGNDSIAIRHMCYLSLTYDHRLVDGADAGRFLATVKKRLEEGQFEAELGL